VSLGVAPGIDPLRRTPTQRRAQDRIQRILDAADGVLARDGSLGTRPVADAAGVSIGSPYHWFPDQESIATAIALRYWDELSGAVAEVAAQARSGALDEPIGDALDALAAGFRARPGFLALWFGELRSERLREVTRPGRERVAASVTQILEVNHPDADPATRAMVARVVTLLGDGVIREAFRVDRAGDEMLPAEGAHALRAYVAARLGAEADG
jgi:AcrR family transcriptional regulator